MTNQADINKHGHLLTSHDESNLIGPALPVNAKDQVLPSVACKTKQPRIKRMEQTKPVYTVKQNKERSTIWKEQVHKARLSG